MDWPVELEELYLERRAWLVRVAYLLVGDVGVAEELVQDAFVATAPRWDSVEYPAAYLRTAVVNRCRSWARRSRLERERVPVAPDSALMEPDEMWDALQRLRPKRRAAVVLRFYEDLPDAEIAVVLGVQQSTVRSLVRRGLSDLRMEIER